MHLNSCLEPIITNSLINCAKWNRNYLYYLKSISVWQIYIHASLRAMIPQKHKSLATRITIFGQLQQILKSWQKPQNTLHEDGLETIYEYLQRWHSVHIAYFTILLMSMGFSVIVTGVWPYLDKVCACLTYVLYS